MKNKDLPYLLSKATLKNIMQNSIPIKQFKTVLILFSFSFTLLGITLFAFIKTKQNKKKNPTKNNSVADVQNVSRW